MYEIVRLIHHVQGAFSFAGVSDPRGKPPLFNLAVKAEGHLDYLLGSQEGPERPD